MMKFTVVRSQHQAPLPAGGSEVIDVPLDGTEVLGDGAVFVSVIESGDGSGGCLSAAVVHALVGARVVSIRVSNLGKSASDRFTISVLVATLGEGRIA
jgi:hypothetical protein